MCARCAGSETHFKVIIVADMFEGMPLITVHNSRRIDCTCVMRVNCPTATQVGHGHTQAGIGRRCARSIHTREHAVESFTCVNVLFTAGKNVAAVEC